MNLRETIETIPLVDNHAHEVQPIGGELTPERYAGYFTEGPGVEQARHTINYRVGLDLLAEVFDAPEANEAVLVERRADVDFDAFASDLLRRSNISHILQDTGTPPGSDSENMAQYTDATVHPILRIENVVEELIEETDSFTAFDEALHDRLGAALARDHVALKSIIAYRTGLEITQPTDGEVAAAYVEVSDDWDGRIEDPVLLDWVINRAASIAASHDAPLQVHSGFGDQDAHPTFVDPARAYDFCQAHPETDVVFLHASYPYTRKAGYIVSVLENAYLDLGMTIPFVQHGTEDLLSRVLELAPTSKLLYSSDGFVVPEWYYLAARRFRSALGTVLEGLVEDGYVTEDYAETTARRLMRENAIELYDL